LDPPFSGRGAGSNVPKFGYATLELAQERFEMIESTSML